MMTQTDREPRNVTVTVSLTMRERESLEAMAKQMDRSLSQTVGRLILAARAQDQSHSFPFVAKHG